MVNAPAGSVLHAEKFSARHEKQPPAMKPSMAVVVSVDTSENRHDFRFFLIEVFQPCVGGTLIVRSVPMPLSIQRKMLLKIKRKVDAWHHASGKKVASHPVAWSTIDKFIGLISVTEDVHKEPTLFVQPVRDTAKYFAVMSEMFEHLNRYYPVEL